MKATEQIVADPEMSMDSFRWKVRLPWAEGRSRFPALFERLAIDVLRECDVSGPARSCGSAGMRPGEPAQPETHVGVDDGTASFRGSEASEVIGP